MHSMFLFNFLHKPDFFYFFCEQFLRQLLRTEYFWMSLGYQSSTTCHNLWKLDQDYLFVKTIITTYIFFSPDICIVDIFLEKGMLFLILTLTYKNLLVSCCVFFYYTNHNFVIFITEIYLKNQNRVKSWEEMKSLTHCRDIYCVFR